MSRATLMRLVLAGAAMAVLPGYAAMADRALGGVSVERRTQALVDGLLAADRAYAAEAQEKGIAGLLAMLDDAVIVPAPQGMLRGKAAVADVLFRTMGGGSGVLSWAPIRVGISADGRHGFTLGYMDARTPGAPDKAAKYLSYWRNSDGRWKVIAFKQAPCPEGERTGLSAHTRLRRQYIPVGDPAAERRALIAREQAFSDAAGSLGLGRAFASFGHADAVNIGRTAGFTVGAEAIGRRLDASGAPKLAWSADGALVAPSGDLGLTWGSIRSLEPGRTRRSIPFFTVWRRDGAGEEWRYVAE